MHVCNSWLCKIYYSVTPVVALFELSIVNNIDGMLNVRWTFKHTGGLPLQSISVSCSGGDTLSNGSLCTPDTCGDGSTSLGPVEAGSNYTCTVTASNAVGNSTSLTNSITTLSGKSQHQH